MENLACHRIRLCVPADGGYGKGLQLLIAAIGCAAFSEQIPRPFEGLPGKPGEVRCIPDTFRRKFEERLPSRREHEKL